MNFVPESEETHMDWRTTYVDISSCMLFESIGDSEEADSNANGGDDTGSSHEATAGLAEDDAFSCSCENECYDDLDHPTGTGDYVYAVNFDEKKLDVEEEEWGEYVSHLCDEYEDEDVESSDANCCNAGDHKKVVLKRNGDEWEAAELETEAGAGQRSKKLKVCGAELELKLNQRDKDRHFWEACLAS